MRALPSTVEDYKVIARQKDSAETLTTLLVLVPTALTFLPATRLLSNFVELEGLFLLLTAVVLTAVLCLLLFLGMILISYLFDKKDIGKSFKIGTFMLKEENSPTKKFLWDKLDKELNEDQLVTFKILLPNFDGSIEDLVIVSKELSYVE